MLFLLLLQAAAPASPPDIELNIRARACSVEIERRGEPKLEVRGGEGSVVEARVEPPARGSTKLRNVTVNVRAEARLRDPAQIRVEGETGTPQ